MDSKCRSQRSRKPSTKKTEVLQFLSNLAETRKAVDDHESGPETDACKTSALLGRWTKSEKKKEKTINEEIDETSLYLEHDKTVMPNTIEIQSDRSKIMVPCDFRVMGVFTKQCSKWQMKENGII